MVPASEAATEGSLPPVTNSFSNLSLNFIYELEIESAVKVGKISLLPIVFGCNFMEFYYKVFFLPIEKGKKRKAGTLR